LIDFLSVLIFNILLKAIKNDSKDFYQFEMTIFRRDIHPMKKIKIAGCGITSQSFYFFILIKGEKEF